MVNPSVIHNNGDSFLWTVTLTKTGLTCPYTVNVTVPPGLAISAFNTPKVGATFLNPIVNVGNMVNGEVVNLYFTVSVLDVTLAVANTFTLSAIVNGCDTNPANNTLTDIVTYDFCPPMAGAVDDNNGCVCGSVATNDTKCSSCDKEWRLVLGSEVNCTVSMDANTGSYNITYTNFSFPASFQYYIWCVNCPDGGDYQVSGPATVTIPALSAVSPIPPTFVQEDFSLLPIATNTVILSNIPLAPHALVVSRNGLVMPTTDWVLFGTTITFTLPFGPTMGATGLESVTVQYFTP